MALIDGDMDDLKYEMEEEARHDGELIRSGVCRLYKGESLVRSMRRFAGVPDGRRRRASPTRSSAPGSASAHRGAIFLDATLHGQAPTLTVGRGKKRCLSKG